MTSYTKIAEKTNQARSGRAAQAFRRRIEATGRMRQDAKRRGVPILADELQFIDGPGLRYVVVDVNGKIVGSRRCVSESRRHVSTSEALTIAGTDTFNAEAREVFDGLVKMERYKAYCEATTWKELIYRRGLAVFKGIVQDGWIYGPNESSPRHGKDGDGCG